MTLITLQEILFFILYLIFLILEKKKVVNPLNIFYRIIYYLVFSIGLIWYIYKSIYIDSLHTNFNVILLCTIVIIVRIIRPYIKPYIKKEIN